MKAAFPFFVCLFFFSSAKVFAKPIKWVGTWYCYSIINEGALNGTLEIKKKGGKKYTWKYNYRNDQNLAADPVCSPFSFEGTAIYNGINSLYTMFKGIFFTYFPEDDKIVVYQDYSDEELTKQSLCFGGKFVRKK